MRILPFLKGHRVARKSWPEDQYYDIIAVTLATITVKDEQRIVVNFPRNDQDYDWKHLGVTPKKG